MSQKFKRKIEDFVCEKCGTFVKGNGYTNHCPKCLWSKHVDVYPGDREGDCGGLMEPVEVEKRGPVWGVVHKCLKCGKINKNKILLDDNFDSLIKIYKK